MNSFHTLIFALLCVTWSPASLADTQTTEQTTQTRTSSNGDFEVTIESKLKPLQLGRMHAWTALVRNSDGTPVTDADIKVGGGMPIHNHGFPTTPAVTAQTDKGIYLIEGIKFSMSGPWVMFLDISSQGITDSVAFDINM